MQVHKEIRNVIWQKTCWLWAGSRDGFLSLRNKPDWQCQIYHRIIFQGRHYKNVQHMSEDGEGSLVHKWQIRTWASLCSFSPKTSNLKPVVSRLSISQDCPPVKNWIVDYVRCWPDWITLSNGTKIPQRVKYWMFQPQTACYHLNGCWIKVIHVSLTLVHNVEF